MSIPQLSGAQIKVYAKFVWVWAQASLKIAITTFSDKVKSQEAKSTVKQIIYLKISFRKELDSKNRVS